MKAKYCYCTNTYKIDCKGAKNQCRVPYYWEHGIGSLTTDPSEITNVITNRNIGEFSVEPTPRKESTITKNLRNS